MEAVEHELQVFGGMKDPVLRTVTVIMSASGISPVSSVDPGH